MKNSNKIIFFSLLILGTMMSINSNSWFSIWMGLEMNLLAFIPLIKQENNLNNSESSLKYFMIQVFASSILLFTIMNYYLIFEWNKMINYYNLINLIFISSLMLKLGMAPFHFWFPNMIEGLNWKNSLILMIWQKIAPLMLIMYCLNLNFLNLMIIFSLLFGSLSGLNQTSLLKIMTFSSINHLSWMIANMINNENLWILYFFCYSILLISISLNFMTFNIYNINQMLSFKISNNNFKKMIFCLPLLSLGGLPPMFGFFPKWMTIMNLLMMNKLLIIICLINFTLLTLFFYLRISYSSFLMNNFFLNWNMNWKIKFNKNYLFMNNFFIFFSMMFLMFTNMIFYLF